MSKTTESINVSPAFLGNSPPAPSAKQMDGSPNSAMSKIALPSLITIVAQLGLLLFIIRQFQIESQAFLRFTVLAFSGFLIHSLIPFRFRLGFFVVLSLTSVTVVLGLKNGTYLIAIGLLLIGIAHLPFRLLVRCLLLLLVGGILAALRAGLLQSPLPTAIWPVLSSMFMFRLIVYLYDLSHEKIPTSPWRTLGYFFMLPNVCFPLFPVVYYKTFRRNYFDVPCYEIYQVGIEWMIRGTIQLLLYRAIYYHLTLAVSEVTSSGKLAQFLLANFLLYLRVSGLFHLIAGMLHLFGFNLPETHHRYLLSGSFTDFWRRINIYWKDFMLKIFYYPLYFKIKSYGGTPALIISTLLVFLATWFLHAYQWFWLRGSFLISPQDVGFWAILAGLVVANSLSEAKHGRERALGNRARTFKAYITHAARTVCTFLAICVLWSFWTCESLSSWLSLWTAAFHITVADIPWIGVLGGVLALIGFFAVIELRKTALKKTRVVHSPFGRSTWLTLASLLVVSGLGVSTIYTHLGVNIANFVHSLRSGRLSRLDAAKLDRGYYEDLLAVDRLDGQLWEVYMNRPLNWLDGHQGSGLDRFTGDFSNKELVPSYRSSTPYGTVTINRWGMRDQDYELEPPASTYRIALLGASSVMGWGVGDDQTFESIVERQLNDSSASSRYQRYEILNFAIPGHKPLQQLVVLNKALSFKPKALFYVATGRETSQAAAYLAEAVRNRLPVPYDFLKNLVQQARLDSSLPEAEAIRRLTPYRGEILIWFYNTVVKSCRERGVIPVWVFLPMVREGAWQEETEGFTQAAEKAGFVMINMHDIYNDRSLDSLRLADWDEHPNAKGHQLIATRLYKEMLNKNNELSLGVSDNKKQ